MESTDQESRDESRQKATIEASMFRRGMRPLKDWDRPFSFFYDETNNAGHVMLSEMGFPSEADRTFVLGGVVLMPGMRIEHIDELRTTIRMQPATPEMKFRHVAAGEYDDVLSSRKLASFLSWFKETGANGHFSFMNILYWALIDIIESLMDRGSLAEQFHRHLKSELYRTVATSQAEFMLMLHSFDYPNIDRTRVKPFMLEISSFLGRHAQPDGTGVADLLKQTIKAAADRDDLVFLHDNRPRELLENFGVHFAHRVQNFWNASHTFDRETSVERFFQRYEIRDGERLLQYQFVDSKDEVAVQVSDVVAGLFGKHFDFVHKNSLATLRSRKKRFNEIQRSNLDAIRGLLDRAELVSDGLLHRIAPVHTDAKNDFFLFDLEPPPGLAL